MSNSLERFGDLLALYDLGAGSWDELVAGAADMVAQGNEAPGMVALASQPARGPRNVFELAALVAAARDEVGMGRLDDVATSIRATQGQIRQWRAGALSDAELLSFVHWIAGDVTPDLVRLWSLFVWLEEPDYFRKDRLEIHDEIEVAADRIAEAVDPWSCRPSA